MKLPSRIGLSSLLSLALAATTVSCQTPEPPPPPPENPGAGGSGGGAGRPSGGSPGGSGGASGSGGGATAGAGGGGGGTAGSAGAGGGNAGAGGGGNAGAGGGGGGASGAGGSAPVDAPPPPSGGDAPAAPDAPNTTPTPIPQPMGTCDFTPKANAAAIDLSFEQITMMGVSVTDTAKGNGSLDGVTEVKFIPGKGMELLVMQKRGRISHLRLASADATTATLVKSYDLPAAGVAVNTTEDCGAISLAFDPGFATNQFIFVGHCTGTRASRITRLTWDGNTLSDPQAIMSWNGAGGMHAWHSVGSIGFDGANNLWVVHGEFTNTDQAQNQNTNLGKLLRMVPSRVAGMGDYTPAAGNPFFNDPKPKSAIYAYGLRSPWRANFDSKGRFIIGDVGDTTNEEINVVTAPGQNFGWGPGSGPCSGTCRSPLSYWRRVRNDCTDPYCGDGDAVKENRAGRAVWVGVQYGNCGTDRYNGALTGVQLFGDFFTGWVRGLVLDDAGNRAVKDADLGSLGGLTSMSQGPDGFLYVGTLGPYDAATAERPGLWRIRPAN